MGLLDLFTKEGRARSALESAGRKVLNKHAQSMDRFPALERLRDIGTDEALFYLARRFSYVYDKTIEDEQEKEWVADTLASFGERAVAPLRRYARGAESVSWPLRVLERVTDVAGLLAAIDELIEREDPGYTRDPQRKLQILNFLGEWKAGGAEATARRILPYLADFDETVRFTAVDAVARHRHEPTVRGPLLDALLRPEEDSRRIKVRVAEVLADAGWTITDRKEPVTKLLAAELPEFGLQHDKLNRKKDK